MLLARWLGPREFGNMAFLLGTFAGVRTVLDMGSSSAYFTFLSQRPRSNQFIFRFFVWIGIQFALPLMLVGLLLPDAWIATIWRDQARSLVLLAFVASFMQNTVWPVVQQTGEAERQTSLVQFAGSTVVVTNILALGALWQTGALRLAVVFWLIAIQYFVAGAMTLRTLIKKRAPGAVHGRVAIWDDVRPFLTYCLPLVPYSAMSFIADFADRWLLQTYGGGVQQAFYAVGSQLSSIALLATTSILRIFWKEIAEAHAQGNIDRAHALYVRVSRMLFFIAASTAGFLIPWSEQVLEMLLGASYAGGGATLAIMLLYPIHQSMGQIGSTVLYATANVRLQVISGMSTMLLGTVVSYFVLAPASAAVPGLGLQSAGLAVKMVAVQLLSVNVIAYLIARLWRKRLDWVYQPVGVLACLGCGVIARAASVAVTPVNTLVVGQLAVAGVCFSFLVSGILLARPEVAGLTQSEVRHPIAVVGKLVRDRFR